MLPTQPPQQELSQAGSLKKTYLFIVTAGYMKGTKHSLYLSSVTLLHSHNTINAIYVDTNISLKVFAQAELITNYTLMFLKNQSLR